MKKVISRVLVVSALAAGIGFCGLLVKTGYLLAKGDMNNNDFYVAMVTDGGGINDQSFQESAWKGLKSFSNGTNARVGYVESKFLLAFICLFRASMLPPLMILTIRSVTN